MHRSDSAAHADHYPTGLVFDLTFEEFSARLTTLANGKLQFHIREGIYARTEVVNIAADCIRTGVFLVSWIESSGATVVHLEDFVEHKVYSHATLPDGTFLRMHGDMHIVEQGIS